jgi:NitT/TauT family transport system substrate-binding protein
VKVVESIVVRILVSRHSAFYSPLISTIAAGFLKEEGVEATYGILPKGLTSREAIRSGKADVIQSAVSSSFQPIEKGEKDLPLHFAQINCRDGFFLVGRRKESAFEWKSLEGRSLLADHALQPLVMLKYAAAHTGVEWARIQVIDAGNPEEMAAAFRSGQADFVHLQGPAAQQIEYDGAGFVTVSVGGSMPAVAFSSLVAASELPNTDAGRAFLRAYARAREWVRSAPADEVARAEGSFFPEFAPQALAAAVAAYQKLGCWDGGIEIPKQHYEQALNVFEAAGAITRRHPYAEVCRQ